MDIGEIQAELDEFESFVDNYTKQMNDILSGKLDEKPMPKVLDSTTRASPDGMKVTEKAPPSDKPKVPEPAEPPNAINPFGVADQCTTQSSKTSNLSALPKKERLLRETKSGPIDYSRFETIDVDDDEDDDEKKSDKNEEKKIERANGKGSEHNSQCGKQTKNSSKRPNHVTDRELLIQASETHKQEGNDAFRVQSFELAYVLYTKSIEILAHPTWDIIKALREQNRVAKGLSVSLKDDPFKFLDLIQLPPPEPIEICDPSIYTNRAFTGIKLSLFGEAEGDCTTALAHIERIRHALAAECRSNTESINLMHADTFQKALWRRSQARKALKNFDGAVEDLNQLKSLLSEPGYGDAAEKRDSKDKSKRLIITLKEVNLALDIIRLEKNDEINEKAAKLELDSSSGSFAVLETMKSLLQAFADRITSPHVQQSRVSEEGAATKNVENMCKTITAMVAEPGGAELFRLAGGFDVLVVAMSKESSSIRLALPLFVAAVAGEVAAKRTCTQISSNSSPNTRKCAGIINDVVSIIVKAKIRDESVIADLSSLLALCSNDPQFLDNICKASLKSSPSLAAWEQFGSFVYAVLLDEKEIAGQYGPCVTANIFRLIASLLAFNPLGASTITSSWAINVTTIFQAIARNISSVEAAYLVRDVESSEPSEESISDVTCFLLLRCLAHPNKSVIQKTARKSYSDIVQAINTTLMKKPKSEHVIRSTLLTCLYNYLVISDCPSSFMWSIDTIECYLHLTEEENQSIANRSMLCLSRLAKYDGVMLSNAMRTLNAWPLLRAKARLQQFKGDIRDVSEIDCLVRIAVAYFRSADDSEIERYWRSDGGFKILAETIINIHSSKTFEKDVAIQKLLGNLGLWIAECARKVTWAEEMYSLGTIDPIIGSLRLLTDSSVKQNLAIACARLCSFGNARQRVKDLKGLELLHGVLN